MPLVYGQKAKGRLVVMPVKFADTGYSKPGEVYEFHLDTTSFAGQEEAVIDQLMLLESRVPDLKVVYAEACDCGVKVKFQVIDTGPGQFSIAGILSLLPAIFVLIGVGIIAYMLWKLYTDVPILLLVGGVAVAFLAIYFFTGQQFFKDITSPYTPKPKAATATQRLQTERAAIDQRVDMKDKRIEQLEKSKQKAQAEIETIHATGGGQPERLNTLLAKVEDIDKQIEQRDKEKDELLDKMDKLAAKYD